MPVGGFRMKQIKEIVELIEDELEGAEEYAKKATKYKDQDKTLADVYARLAQTEMTHVDTLHDQAVRLINEQKKAGVQVPASMQAIWDWEHGKQVDTAARVKSLMAVYRGE